MLDSLRNGLEFQVMLVIIAAAVIALLIVAAATWGWWKFRQLARHGRELGWTPPGRGGELAIHRFASSGGRDKEPTQTQALHVAGDSLAGESGPASASGDQPSAHGGAGPPLGEQRAPRGHGRPRSETRELFEYARRYATVRARQLGERLRPEIDRAQQRVQESAALRDAAARLRSVREAWDRPASEDAASSDGSRSDATSVSGRLDELLAEQRTTNELLRALLERLGRS